MAQSFAAKAYWLRSTALLCAFSAPLITPAAHAETLTYSPNTHRQTWSQLPQDAETLIDNPYQKRRFFIRSGQAPPTVKPLRLPSQAQAAAAQPSAPKPNPPPTPRAAPLKIVIPNIKPGEVKAAQKAEPGQAPPSASAMLVASAPPIASLAEPASAAQAASPGDTSEPPPPLSTSFASQPQRYHSPGIIIRRHEVIKTGDRSLAMEQPIPSPEKLAQLSPAAGGEGAVAPLIPEPPATDSVQPLLDTASGNASPPREPQGPDDIVITDIVTSHGVIDTGRSSETNSNAADMMQALGTQPPMPQARSDMPNLLPLLGSPGRAGAGMAVAASEDENASEPLADLSNESKKIAGKIPSNLDKRKNSRPPHVDIARAKNLDNIFTPPAEPADENVSRHEAPGLSIEVRSRKANISYELEKAYNALIAGQTEAAIATYKSVLESDPKNVNALFGLATTYHRAGQIELARPLYGKILTIDPDNREALNNFMVLMADEAPQAALEQLERLEQRNPDFSPIPAQMAVIYQKLGDMGKASEKMFQAVGLAPENLTYRYNLAVLMDKQQKYDEAVRLYRQLLEAYDRGETLPGSAQKIQERLTFISSNRR